MAGMLDGRVAIVTGAGRGLGRAHALELARHGAHVVVNDVGAGLKGERTDATPADEVVAEITAAGGVAMADATSVTDFVGVHAMVERTIQTFGRLDVVVNNAGILRDRMITSMTEEDFDAVIAVHLKGTFCVTRHACEHWRTESKRGARVAGRIINTTSGAGLWGSVGQSNYATAKAGLVGMTTSLALEMERYGVTVNAISPIARTRMTEGLAIAAERAGGFDKYEPANASPVVAWLASESSGWLTGAVLRIDGDRVQRVRNFEVDPKVDLATAPGSRLDATKLDRALRTALALMPPGLSTTAKA